MLFSRDMYHESTSGCPRIHPGSDVHAASQEIIFEVDDRSPHTHRHIECQPWATSYRGEAPANDRAPL